MARRPAFSVERSVVVHAPPARVLEAFVTPHDLAEWWEVVRSVTVPRPLGTYAIEWEATEHRDDLLGRLGGALHGTVMEFRPAEELFVGDLFWTPPDGDSLGPMALEIRCAPHGSDGATRLAVRHSGDSDGPRWQRYFELMDGGWQRALANLQEYLEGTP